MAAGAKVPFHPIGRAIMGDVMDRDGPPESTIRAANQEERARILAGLLERARGEDDRRAPARRKLGWFLDDPEALALTLEALELPEGVESGNDRQAAFLALAKQLPDAAVPALRRAVERELDVVFRPREDPVRRMQAASQVLPALGSLARKGDPDAPAELAELAKAEFPEFIRQEAFQEARAASIHFARELVEEGFEDGILDAGFMLVLDDEAATDRVIEDWERDGRCGPASPSAFRTDNPVATMLLDGTRERVFRFAAKHHEERPALLHRVLLRSGPDGFVVAACCATLAPERLREGIAEALRHEHPAIRQRAVHSLDHLPPDDRVALARDALRDEPDEAIAAQLRIRAGDASAPG